MHPDLACFVGAVGWSSGPHVYAALLPAVPSPQPHGSNFGHFQICDPESSLRFAV